jgi:hypothetical protein
VKARNREINIFNMSLLDILCGALGTFCFLMLVLFPYYSTNKSTAKAPEVPPGVDPKTYEQAMARIKELEEALQKFQSYSKQLEGQVNQLQAQVQQLEQKLAKASERVDQMEYRNPFLATMILDKMSKDDDFELYIDDRRITTDKKKSTPKLDPERRQGSFWPGDMALSGKDLNFGYFMVRDGPSQDYNVYVKVLKHNPAGPPVDVVVLIQTGGVRKVAPEIWVTKEKMLIPVGVVKVAPDYAQTIEFNVPQEVTVKPGAQAPPQPEERKQQDPGKQ